MKFYARIGEKLQILALCICTLISIAAGVVGAWIWFSMASNGNFLGGLFRGALCFGGGLLIGWLSSCILYAFGQLVDDTTRSVLLLEDIAARLKK